MSWYLLIELGNLFEINWKIEFCYLFTRFYFLNLLLNFNIFLLLMFIKENFRIFSGCNPHFALSMLYNGCL